MNLHTDQIHHQDRVHTRPHVMSHLRCWHVPTIMNYELRIMNYPTSTTVIPAPPKSTCYSSDRVHTRPYVLSHLRCWHVPTIMNYELRIMNYPTSTTVIPAPPKSTCSSRNVLTCGTVFRYSRITCRSTPVPVPCRIRTVPASSIIASSI